jgi:dihydroxyacetone kinase-like predicted kinase
MIDVMHKQRNDVEKATQELSEQIKTVLAQRLYTALNDAKIERPKIIQILGVVNAAVDETNGRFSKHFFKAVDDLVKTLSEKGDKKPGSKSKA